MKPLSDMGREKRRNDAANMGKDDRAVLIDGHNFLYRSYFGVPASARTKEGVQVNAVYGFLAILRSVCRDLKPTYMMVVFDSETGCDNRLAISSDYKANRVNEDTGMFLQLPVIKQILDLASVKYVEPPDCEADDQIGSAARTLGESGFRVFICSNDSDFFQLVDDRVAVARYVNGLMEVYDSNRIFEQVGVAPQCYADYLALKGDPTDNIRGIPGVGQKRAKRLIDEFGCVDSVLETNGDVDFLPTSVCEFIRDEPNLILQAKQLVQIDTSRETGRLNDPTALQYDVDVLTDRAMVLLSQVGIS